MGDNPISESPPLGRGDSVESVMVTGSRSWSDDLTVWDVLDGMHSRFPNMRIFQGGAAGADRIAAEWAQANNIVYVTFAPDYSRPSPQRYHERNDAMLRRADRVVAFWDGLSSGTASVIQKACERDIPLEVHRTPAEAFNAGAVQKDKV